LAVYWEFRSFNFPGEAAGHPAGSRSLFQLLAILGEFREFTAAGAAAANKPG